MAMRAVTVGSTPSIGLVGADGAPIARAGARIDVVRLDTAAAIGGRLVELGIEPATAFQSAPWLAQAYGQLAPALGATPLALDVRDSASGATILFLPMVLRREGCITTATFADLGVSDYNAPLVARDVSPGMRRAVWRSIRRALPEADLIRLERMPARTGLVANPLITAAGGAMRSRMSQHALTVEGSVEDLLRSRGKKFRKEAERCYRLLDKEGARVFRRAETADEISRAYAALSAQQQARHEGEDQAYVLSDPAYADFYARLAEGASGDGFAHLFTLEAGGEIVATLFGVAHADTFTLLRISNGGARWRHASPGRIVVLEGMRYFIARGITRFDMGVGDYGFKRGFGIVPEPLFDVVTAGSWRGLVPAAAARAKGFVRAHPRLLAAARRLAGRR